MIVDHVQDCDRGHLFRVDPAIVLARKRPMIGFENESVGVNEIDRELPFSIATDCQAKQTQLDPNRSKP